MAILSDHSIDGCVKAGRIEIDPYNPENLQPASIDLTLSNVFKQYTAQHSGYMVDPRIPVEMDTTVVSEGLVFVLPPQGFALGATVERLRFPNDIVGRIEGKSSLGRLGLTAHVTAGFFDPGFNGQATLELHNVSPYSILLWPGMLICQMSFHRMTTPARRPYGSEGLRSKYIDQVGPVASKMHENFDK